MTTASGAVQEVVSVDAETREDRLDALLENSASSLQDNFGADLGELTDEFTEQTNLLSGYVQQAAIVTLDSSTGVVLIDAARSTSRTDEQGQRGYRFQVSVQREGDTWRVSRIRPEG